MRSNCMRSKKLWYRPHSEGLRKVWPPLRLYQLLQQALCFVIGHDWDSWRIETEDWYEQPVAPRKYAWRGCKACHLIEHWEGDE